MKKQINTISAFQFNQLARYSTLILTGVVFTKTALAQTEIGEYETFTFLAGAVSFFWLTGLLKALLPISSEETGSKTNIFSAFVVIQFFSVIAAAFLCFLQPFFSEFLLNGKAIPQAGLLLVFIVFGVPANLVEYFYLIKKKNRSMIVFFVQFVLVVLPPVLGHDILMSLKGLVLSSILRYVWLWIIMVRFAEIRFSAAFVKAHLQLGGPLVVATLFSGSAQFIDGFIVTAKFDETTFAVFRYGARELPLAMLLANALSNAMLPEFSNRDNLKSTLEKLKSNVSGLMHFLFPLTAILLLISHPVFPVLFNPAFAESATIFNIYLLLIISRLLMPQTILNGLRISKPIMYASFFELVLNVFLSLLFVQFWGIAGIAFATFLAYLFEKIYLSIVVRRELKIAVSEYLPVKYFVFWSVVTLVLFTFAEYFYR